MSWMQSWTRRGSETVSECTRQSLAPSVQKIYYKVMVILIIAGTPTRTDYWRSSAVSRMSWTVLEDYSHQNSMCANMTRPRRRHQMPRPSSTQTLSQRKLQAASQYYASRVSKLGTSMTWPVIHLTSLATSAQKSVL